MTIPLIIGGILLILFVFSALGSAQAESRRLQIPQPQEPPAPDVRTDVFTQRTLDLNHPSVMKYRDDNGFE